LVSIALIAGGVVLIIFGINAMNSFSSDVSRFFTGSPTDKAVWMLLGGVVARAVGVGLTLSGWKRAYGADPLTRTLHKIHDIALLRLMGARKLHRYTVTVSSLNNSVPIVSSN
jgi:hypothetical protein